MFSKKWLKILIALTSVITLSVLGFIYSNDLLNLLQKKDNSQPTFVGKDLPFSTFPTTKSSYLAGGTKQQWKMRLFQGLIKSYEEIDGNTYIILSVTNSTREIESEVKVLISLSKENVPKRFDYSKDGVSLLRFNKEFVDTIGFYSSINKYAKGEPILQQFKLSEFKEAFTEGTAISFLGFTNLPLENELTQEYCNENGLYFCMLSELTSRYTVNLDDFWDDSKPFNGIIVPYEKYLDIISD